MVFKGNKFYPLATLTRTVPVVSVGGLAKQFLVPGWRVGWILVHDHNKLLEKVRQGFFRLSQLILGANSLVQSAIPAILTPKQGSPEEKSLIEFKRHYLHSLQENAHFSLTQLEEIPEFHVVVPQGAMYVMVCFTQLYCPSHNKGFES